MEHAGGKAGNVFGTGGILPIILEKVISPPKARNTLKIKNLICNHFVCFVVKDDELVKSQNFDFYSL